MSSSNEDILIKLGLSRVESAAYMGLVKTGLTTTGKLVKESGVPSSKIYGALTHLVELGLVSYTIIKNRKYFKAENPDRLKDVIIQKESDFKKNKLELMNFVENLRVEHSSTKSEDYRYLTYEGIAGIKTALDKVLDVLNEGDSFIVFGAPKIGNDRLNGFFDEFHKKRAKAKIKYKVIYNEDAKKYGEKRKTYSLTEVKYLPKGVITPSVFWIFKDCVAVVIFTNNLVAFVIKDEQVAQSFMAYFGFMWKMSKT